MLREIVPVLFCMETIAIGNIWHCSLLEKHSAIVSRGIPKETSVVSLVLKVGRGRRTHDNEMVFRLWHFWHVNFAGHELFYLISDGARESGQSSASDNTIS